MIKYLTALWVLLYFQVALSQNNSGRITIHDTNVDPAGIVDELPLAPPKTIGDTYIEDDWMLGDVELLNGKKIDRYPLKYDLKNNELDISYNGEVRTCPAEKIKYFSWNKVGQKNAVKFVNTTYLINVKKGNPREVMAQAYSGNLIGLYKQYYLDFKESTYVPALDMGNKNNKILVKSYYYVLQNNEFFKLSMTLRKNKILFGGKYTEVENHSKENKLKLKKEEDLIKLIKFYETLL